MEFPGLLTVTVFLPLAGALVIAGVIRGDQRVRVFAAVVALASFVLAIIVFASFDQGGAERFQLIDELGWIGVDSVFK